MICPGIVVLAKETYLEHKTKKHKYYVKELFNVLQYNTKSILDKLPMFHLHGFFSNSWQETCKLKILQMLKDFNLSYWFGRCTIKSYSDVCT